MKTHQIEVSIGSLGMGRAEVLVDPSAINLLRNHSFHGVPHARPHENGDGHAWIEVLGAVPDSSVIVSFQTEE